MLYVIIGLNVLIIILVVISITKNINESNITERLGKLETNMVKEVGSFQNEINLTQQTVPTQQTEHKSN